MVDFYLVPRGTVYVIKYVFMHPSNQITLQLDIPG